MALTAKPKPPASHRKRQALHHNQSKHYKKAYWPYLPMLLVVVVGLAINSLWATGAAVLGAKSDFSGAGLLAGTNAARAGKNEPPLSIDAQLTSAAQAKANDMAARNYWSHNTPDGQAPWTFIAATGYSYQAAGENLAYGFSDASATITGWMNSQEHRANILNASYTQVGFGVTSAANYQGKGPAVIVVALYATPVSGAANVSFTVPAANATSGGVLGTSARGQPSSRLVSRIQLLTDGQAPWSLVAVSLITGAAVMLFLIRHGLRLKRLLVEGEVFVSHHLGLDFVVVVVATVGFILTRTSGIIR